MTKRDSVDTDLRGHLHEIVRAVFARSASYESEEAFQVAFAAELGNSERELRALFAPALHAPKRPPQIATDELARRSIVLPAEGRDPCARAAKLDVLWSSSTGPVPIELKYRTLWNGDTYGYMFLKDLHRLERMTSAGRHSPLCESRFAIFATTEAVYWKGERPEPKPFWLTDGSRRARREWIQYDQPSAHTMWYGYPPFYLANEYSFEWRDLGRSGRYLLVEVSPQR